MAMEHLHCIKNALCLFCGLPGHSAKDCPRSMSCTAKACTAQAASIAASTVETPAKTSTLPNPDSLKPVVYIPDYNISDVITLLDSGSSHCFIDPAFIKKHNVIVEEISPIPLHLFNGTCNSFIIQLAHFSVCFPSGNVTPFSFYVTPLDSSCSFVLGYNWLTCYNLLIDWVLGSINFHSVLQGFPKQSQPTMEKIPEDNYSLSPSLSDSPQTAPHISLVNAAAFVCACKLEGSVQFSLQLCPEDAKLHAVSMEPAP
ncbi:hypothetical protein ID866_12854, partial [Astraeus odoratus]